MAIYFCIVSRYLPNGVRLRITILTFGAFMGHPVIALTRVLIASSIYSNLEGEHYSCISDKITNRALPTKN